MKEVQVQNYLLDKLRQLSKSKWFKIHDLCTKAIPDILKRDFGKIEFPLPTEEEIEKIYDFTVNSVKENKKFVMPTEKEKRRIISGARGLTSSEIIKTRAEVF